MRFLDVNRRLPALGLAMLAFAACVPIASGPATVVSSSDPGAPGQYSAGSTARSFTYMLQSGQPRTLAVDIWFPEGASQQPHPVVIFSHGYQANPMAYSLLLIHLASHGFVVAAPEHKDCPANCTAADYEAEVTRRPQDVRAVLDNLLTLNGGDDPLIKNLIDGGRVGVAGQSFGGWTTLHVLQADPRFRAGLAMNPATFNRPAADPALVSKPLLMMAGELDSMVPFSTTEEFYASIPSTAPDRFLLVVPRAGHEFTDRCIDKFLTISCSEAIPQSQLQNIVDRLATAFLESYVAADSTHAAMLDPAAYNGPDYTLLETKSGASSAAVPTALPAAASVSGSVVVAASAGTVIVSDDMGDVSHQALPQPAQDPTRFSQAYVNGEYVISPPQVGSAAPLPNQVEALLADRYADAALAVHARLVNPTPDQYLNIGCRSQDDLSNYRLTVFPVTGVFQVVRWVHGTAGLLAGPRPSPAIRTGGQANQLQLSCHGTVIDASINGVLVASVTDGTFGDGQMWIGLGHSTPGSQTIHSSPGNLLEGHYTNLVVTQL